MSDQSQGLKYLKIPKWVPVETADVFTRMDEELAEIIKGIDLIIQLLAQLISISQGIGIPVVIQPPGGGGGTPGQIPPFPSKIITIPSKLKLLGTSSFSVDTDYKEINIGMGDVVILTNKDDVYIAARPSDEGFLLNAGVYLVFSRASDMDRLYAKAVTGTTTVYVSFWQIES